MGRIIILRSFPPRLREAGSSCPQPQSMLEVSRRPFFSSEIRAFDFAPVPHSPSIAMYLSSFCPFQLLVAHSHLGHAPASRGNSYALAVSAALLCLPCSQEGHPVAFIHTTSSSIACGPPPSTPQRPRYSTSVTIPTSSSSHSVSFETRLESLQRRQRVDISSSYIQGPTLL